MTTSPVVSVTDELIAELESVAHSNDADRMEVHGISVGIVRALLAERAELKRDADCLRWLLDNGDNTQWQNILRIEVDDYATVRDAINEVMRQDAKP